MNHIYKIITLSILVSISTWITAGSVSSGWVSINKLGTGTDNSRINLSVTSIKNPAGCSLSDYYQVNESSSNNDKIFAIALAAHASRKKVELIISDSRCSASNRPFVQAIYMNKQ